MYKIIVVEDENKIRKGFINLLDWEQYNFKVVGSAKNGEEGIEVIKKIRPDLVFTDIKMPIIDGLTMIKKTQEYDYYAVIISGFDDYELMRQSIQSNVFDYILKPIEVEPVIKILRNVESQLSYRSIYEEYQKSDHYNLLYNREHYNTEYSNRVSEILERSASQQLKTETIAEMLNISVPTLNNYLKKEKNKTFHQIKTLFYLQKAIELIWTTDLLNYEIGYKIGYIDYDYFSKIFKEYTGKTINEIREEII